MASTNLNNTTNYIRNILRQEGITGMDSINHCLIFLISRYMDTELCNKTGIDEKYSFHNLMKDKDGKERGDHELFDLFYKKSDPKCFCAVLLNKLKFNNGKFKLTGVVNLKSIMKSLEKLDINHLDSQYDLVGTIYEIHLRSGTSNAMRDLGQYFTHRLVIKYMVELCKPTLVNGKVETIVDPTMGTGGFLTMAIKYLNKNNKDIDWNENIKNIYGFDLDENVKNMALLNILLECNELSPKTIVQQDTLKNDLKLDSVNTLQKAKVILANEPMGIKGLKYVNFCDRVKNLKISGTKAEPAFLQLFMEALDDGGRCAVVIPDGVLFNDSNQHNGTRKHLIENFNLKKVIALNDSEFFLNTGVKTSILFFCKDGKKTQEVEFSELKLDNGKLKENSIIKIKYVKLANNNYSLFVNKYNVQEMDKIEGIEYKKLKDLTDIQFGNRVIKSKVAVKDDYDGIKYPCYGGGNISFYTKDYNRDGQNLVISRFGISEKCVRIIKGKFYLNDSGFTLKSNNKILHQRYLEFYTLNCLQNKIYDLSKGACQKNINIEDFNNLEIPVPSLKVQKNIVERLDVINDNTQTLKTNIEQFKKMLKYYVDAHTRHEKKEKLEKYINSIKTGKNKPKDNKKGTLYPYYGTNGITGHTDEYLFEGKYILTPRNGTIGLVFKVNSKFYPSDHVFVIENKSTINYDYLYYYIKTCVDLDSKKHGSTIPNITKKDISESNIKIPSLEKQKEIVSYCDNLSGMISSMENQITENEKLMKDTMNMFMKSFSKSKTS
jgi:type I restriction-modification system DNA methylase subunit